MAKPWHEPREYFSWDPSRGEYGGQLVYAASDLELLRLPEGVDRDRIIGALCRTVAVLCDEADAK